MFKLNAAILIIGLSAIAQGHSHRRRLAPETSIIEALHEQLAGGVDNPRFTISADYEEGGLFASEPFAIDVVLTNPSVDESTSFSVDGGPNASVQSTSKFFIADSDSKQFVVLNVDEEKGLVSGLVQKDGKLLKLEQRQGGATLVTEAAKFDPPKDWECTVARDRPATPVAKENPDTGGRRLSHEHHSHEHHEHSHHTHSHTLDLSSSSESIFSQVSNINHNMLKNRRRLTYQTDDFPLKWSYQVDLYIEVDTAMVQARDPNDQTNMPNTIAYINALITAASSVYEKEVDTHLHVLHISKTTIYDNESDTMGALDVMMGQYSNSNAWHYTDSVTNETPDLHHGIFYKSMGGGVAYLSAVCDSEYGYGVSAGVKGSLDDIGGEMFWDLTVVMHELGHNFGSDHTHDTGGYNPQVDACGSGSCQSLVTGNQVQQGEATIMSYCHQCSGGESNIGATFGGHWIGGNRGNVNNWVDNSGAVPFNQDPRRVAKTMYEHVSSRGQCTDPYLPVPTQVCSSDSDCDDGFSCSTDTCDVASGTCSSTFKDNCCGNGQCESGENGSSCPTDCGPFELATPTCSQCYIPYHAMFDIEAIRDIELTSLSFRLYGGVSDINIYSAPQSYSNIATNSAEWTLIASGSVSLSDWAFVTADLTSLGIEISAGSKRAFYIGTTGQLAIADDASTPLAADDNLRLLNPTRVSWDAAEFESASSGVYSWYGSISYTVDGGDSAPTTNLPTKAPTTNPPTKAPLTTAPTKSPITVRPTPNPSKAPVTSEPTSTNAAGFVKMDEGGYCLDSLDRWYSAFKSDPLPADTSDSYCLNWCGAISRTDLVAIESYTDGSNVFCYCDFPNGGVPQDIALSDFDPAAGGIVTYDGDGEVVSTDSVQGATCYFNQNFMPSTNAPSRKPTTKSPTRAPTKEPTTPAPVTSAPVTSKPTSSPSATPTVSPTSASPTSVSPTSSNPISSSPVSSKPSASPSPSPTSLSPVTPSPVSSAPSTTPSASPNVSSTSCYPQASSIKIQSTTDQPINLFEVKAISSSGINVAMEGAASQSSTLKNRQKFEASNAIDGADDGSFSHTDNGDSSAWWQVTFGGQEINRISLSNRYCGDTNDSTGCLCRLSSAKVQLFDSSGSMIEEILLGNTCGLLTVDVDTKDSCSTPSPTPSAVNNLPKARYLKLHSITGQPIHVNEIEVYDFVGANVAIGKVASQSSTLKAFEASRAIDGDASSFSHTSTDDSSAMFEIDLGSPESISNVRIVNRWCGDPSDPSNCLCRLSFTMLSLFDGDGNWISTTNIGNTCNKLEWNHDFSAAPLSTCDTLM